MVVVVGIGGLMWLTIGLCHGDWEEVKDCFVLCRGFCSRVRSSRGRSSVLGFGFGFGIIS